MQRPQNRERPFRKQSFVKRGFRSVVYVLAFAATLASAIGCDRNDRERTNIGAESDVVRKPTSPTTDDNRRQEAKREEVARNAAPQRRKETSPRYSLDGRDDIRTVPQDFPDLSKATDLTIEHVQLASIPDILLERIATEGKSLRSLSISVCGRIEEVEPPGISDAGMELLSRLSNLEQLHLQCRFSADGFAHLTKLKKLKTLGLDKPTIGVREYFATVSKFPNIRGLGVRYADFSQPIDDETFKAIASLNGRLEDLGFGEWQETVIHASMIPAIAEIKSLAWLALGGVVGTLPKPWTYYLHKLPYLERIEPCIEETRGAAALSGLRAREGCPVQFRKVKSPAEMVVLLRFVLGTGEADKVRREVVHRRAGLSPRPPEGFPKLKYPLLVTILDESFGVQLPRSASRVLSHISGRYPELDLQIRRYLAGEDFLEEEVKEDRDE